MRGDPDQHEDLEYSSRSSSRYEDSSRGSLSSDSYIFRKSPLTIRTHTPPARCDSPPNIYPSSPPPNSNSTPLLTASLNAPVAYYNNITRGKSDVTAQVAANNKSKTDESNCLSTNPQSVMYSTLISQLQRQKAGGETSKPTAASIQHQSLKIKKEKSRPLPFMCPACKKRFQRHIAMNAHFQNEHISLPAPNGERTCKLCGSVSASLNAVRQHLRVVHNIDLDNPSKCLEESKPLAAAGLGSKYSVLEASLRSGGFQDEAEPSCSNIEMFELSGQSSPQSISPSPAHTPTSSESPERALFPIKHDLAPSQQQQMEEDDPQVEDLSIRKPSPVLPRRYSPRPDSPGCSKQSKRAKLRENSSSPPTSLSPGCLGPTTAAASVSGYTCIHCNIVYPNQTLYFLHRGFHSESNPWRCNSCGHISSDLYDFNTHLFSVAHQ